MQQNPSKLFSTEEDKQWLREANQKADLIRRALAMQKQIPRDIFLKALEVHEATEWYLNQMPVVDLGNLVKD